MENNKYPPRIFFQQNLLDEWRTVRSNDEQDEYLSLVECESVTLEAVTNAFTEAANHFEYAATISQDERWPEAAGYEAAARYCRGKALKGGD